MIFLRIFTNGPELESSYTTISTAQKELGLDTVYITTAARK